MKMIKVIFESYETVTWRIYVSSQREEWKGDTDFNARNYNLKKSTMKCNSYMHPTLSEQNKH